MAGMGIMGLTGACNICIVPVVLRYCNHYVSMNTQTYIIRADSRFALSQRETALLCKDISHWLDANRESALIIQKVYIVRSQHYGDFKHVLNN